MKKQFRTRLSVLILLVLLLIVLVSFAGAKYVTTKTHSTTITFSASLAENVILQESKAERQADGSYVLGGEYVQTNAYKLIPGLDIPKDPHIIIEGKTPIQAFLFVEVVSTLDTPVAYAIDDSNWQELAGVTGKNGGKVYQYISVLDENFSGDAINILKDKQVVVGQKLLSQSDAEEDLLAFYVTLIEKTTESATPAQAYAGYQQT